MNTSAKVCPFGNLTSVDKFLGLTASNRMVRQNVTWWNDVSYATPHDTVTGANGGIVGYMNQTGATGCAFTIQKPPKTYTSDFLGGLLVHLKNRFLPESDVAYDFGAVVYSQPGIGSVMVQPPMISTSTGPSGPVVKVTFVTIVGDAGKTVAGTGIADLTARIVLVSSVHFPQVLNQSNYLRSPFVLTLTTAFPMAWSHWFKSLPTPVTATCTPTGGVFLSQCLTPPVGKPSIVSAPFPVSDLTLTDILVSVTLS